MSLLRAAAARDFLLGSRGGGGGRACPDELSRELGAAASGVSDPTLREACPRLTSGWDAGAGRTGSELPAPGI